MTWLQTITALAVSAALWMGLGFKTVEAGQLLFETANGADQSSGVLLDDDSWIMHRFEVTSSSRLETVGGAFWNFDSAAATAFAAVVQLSGPSDFPDSNNLSTADLLGTTFVDIAGSQFDAIDSSGPIDLTLAPGWYALVFGTGAFGASSGTQIDLGMPSFENDLAPSQEPASLFQPSHPTLANQIVVQIASPRFFATVVPEPATVTLLMMGIGAPLMMRRARGGRR
jgi:hypothetical protein